MRRSQINDMQVYCSYNMGKADLKSLSLLFLEMAENMNLDVQDIYEVGYNSMSGYTYISLENSIDLASIMGEPVQFLVTDSEEGTEYFLQTYDEALAKCEEIEKVNIKSFN
jgi:hypothetical protein